MNSYFTLRLRLSGDPYIAIILISFRLHSRNYYHRGRKYICERLFLSIVVYLIYTFTHHPVLGRSERTYLLTFGQCCPCWTLLYPFQGSKFGLLKQMRLRNYCCYYSYFSSKYNVTREYLKLCVENIYKAPLPIYSAF